MDFVSGKQTTRKGNDYVFVVVYRLSKMCILMPCKKTIKGQEATNMFFEQVWVHFGIPRSIISDMDTRFINAFWTTLWDKMDTKLKRSIAFHPQTEVVNRILVQLLRSNNHKHPKTLDENLIYIKHSYNKAVHTSTGKPPFETCFSYFMPSPLDVVDVQQGGVREDITGEALKADHFVEKIRQIHLQVQETLKKSQAKYTARHDQHRTNKSWKVGDRVWLPRLNKERLQGPGNKIKALRYGPFEVLERWEITPTDLVYPHTCAFT